MKTFFLKFMFIFCSKNKRNSRHRVAFSDYSYRRLASTYQHHIRPPLFNYSFYRPIYYNDLDQPARLERINDVHVGRNTDIGVGIGGLGQQHQGHSQEELHQDGLSQENLGEGRIFEGSPILKFVFPQFRHSLNNFIRIRRSQSASFS